jgi:hypothetical protein
VSYRKLRRKPCSTISEAITSANFAGKSQRKNDERNKHMKTITNIIYPTFALFAFACFALSSAPNAFGVVPAPDGGYPGFNTAEGQNALLHLITGTANTAVGWVSLENVTTGSFNTGVGAGTLVLNSGDQNTATGAAALLLNTTGGNNTANGALALLNNTEGFNNTAIGNSALYSNTIGDGNTATGRSALQANTTAVSNTANGYEALFNNTEGSGNTATGLKALRSNTTGSSNTATGLNALFSNSTGGTNTATGFRALFSSTGDGNVGLGFNAGLNVTTASNVIAIGSQVSGENVSNACYIGNIFGVTSTGAAAVYVNSVGKLGTAISSRRFKDEINPMEKASEAILALKPVTFRYKQEIDPTHTPQFGLVAEDVEKVNPDLVVRDAEGKVNTVRYEAVNAMLLNEFLKEHHRVEEQQATITQLKSTVAQQQKETQSIAAQQQKEIQALAAIVKEQASEIQKVSAQVELQKAAPKTVLNNQ